MLHTLHRSPWLTDFAALLRLLSEGDELLLLQDGVTAAVDGNRYLESLRNAPIKVYALNEDLIARGLSMPSVGLELMALRSRVTYSTL